MQSGVLLIAHGTVDDLADVPAFLANIRRGHPAPQDVVDEVLRRYRAIGGLSPLNAINRRVAAKLEARLGVPVRICNRLWKPYQEEVLAELAALGATKLAVLPLAQFSTHLYAETVAKAEEERAGAGAKMELSCAANWGELPELTRAFASRIRSALTTLPDSGRAQIVLTAHSLPVSVIEAGDPYAHEVEKSANAISRELGRAIRLAYQSQGMSTGPGGRPIRWLGPELRPTLELAFTEGSGVVVAPIGFLADHVEILYDLDIEAKGWAGSRGAPFARTESLNDADDFIEALATVARPLL